MTTAGQILAPNIREIVEKEKLFPKLSRILNRAPTDQEINYYAAILRIAQHVNETTKVTNLVEEDIA
jgi:hypothetical protein